jgi:site-specific recombinase XerD
MLEEKIKGFIAYCKAAGFKEKSIETLSLRLHEFNQFLKSKRSKSIQSVTYSHLSTFVADHKFPSVHVKKARDVRGFVYIYILKEMCKCKERPPSTKLLISLFRHGLL